MVICKKKIVSLQKFKLLYTMAKKVLFINTEITPYVPETPLSLLGKSVPQAIQENGF